MNGFFRFPIAAALVLALVSAPSSATDNLPSGFQLVDIFTGLDFPVAVEFASDGRIFVAEKSGIIKVFDGLNDSSPDVFADLRLQVLNFQDRGLLGLALHPEFPQTPYVYVSYAADLNVSQSENDQYDYPPKWGTDGSQDSDPCPDPPGGTAYVPGQDISTAEGGCIGAGRLSRLQASVSSNQMVGDEVVLIQDWFQQFPSHSMGDIEFGSDGYLYASSGDGASFWIVDYGDIPSDVPGSYPLDNFPDDPIFPGFQNPSSEGGALRSQDLETTGDATGLNGSLIRVDPITGLGAPGNPLAESVDLNRRRIVAYGYRNPFRFGFITGTRNVWLGDVGWNTTEEVNYISNAGNTLVNHGWPCFEGSAPALHKVSSICRRLRGLTAPPALPGDPFVAHSPPTIEYNHQDGLGQCSGPGDASPTAFQHYDGSGNYPGSFDNRMFFGDFSRGCIWTIRNSNGSWLVEDFLKSTPNRRVVDMARGPSGDLYLVEIQSAGQAEPSGRVVHLRYGSNLLPTAVITLVPPSVQEGPPRTVSFSGSSSSDPEGGNLSYAWDLDGDGQYDDSTSMTPSYNYQSVGSFLVGLKVTDNAGLTSTTAYPIYTDNGLPDPVITAPLPGTLWSSGHPISFAGSATDVQDGAIPGPCPGGGNSKLEWTLKISHCSSTNPSDCHQHIEFSNLKTVSGSYTSAHEFPSGLELSLKATDCDGRSVTVTRDIEMDLRFASGFEVGTVQEWSLSSQ